VSAYMYDTCKTCIYIHTYAYVYIYIYIFIHTCHERDDFRFLDLFF
jgi:hypothetical protein